VVLMANCYRRYGQGFVIDIRPVSQAIADTDLTVAATALNAAIEASVRKHPEQYLWRYPRFED